MRQVMIVSSYLEHLIRIDHYAGSLHAVRQRLHELPKQTGTEW